MSGQIQGIVFTVVAYSIYKSRNEEWVSFQLYSDTHSYALLIRKDRQYSFYRKNYHLPDKNLWVLKRRDHFTALNQNFIITNFYITEITSTAGTLITSVRPSKHDKQCFADSKKMKYLSIQHKQYVSYFQGYEITDSEIKATFST